MYMTIPRRRKRPHVLNKSERGEIRVVRHSAIAGQFIILIATNGESLEKGYCPAESRKTRKYDFSSKKWPLRNVSRDPIIKFWGGEQNVNDRF